MSEDEDVGQLTHTLSHSPLRPLGQSLTPPTHSRIKRNRDGPPRAQEGGQCQEARGGARGPLGARGDGRSGRGDEGGAVNGLMD